MDVGASAVWESISVVPSDLYHSTVRWIVPPVEFPRHVKVIAPVLRPGPCGFIRRVSDCPVGLSTDRDPVESLESFSPPAPTAVQVPRSSSRTVTATPDAGYTK